MEAKTEINTFVNDFINKKEFEANEYYDQVLKCSENYIIELKIHFKLDIDINEYMDKIKKTMKILQEPLVHIRKTPVNSASKTKVKLKSILEKYGFDITKIYNSGFYKWFIPSNISLGIVYCLLINELRKCKVNPRGLTTVCKLFNNSHHAIRLVNDYIRNSIEEEWGINISEFRWDNEKFKERIYNSWRKTGRMDLQMVYELFKILNFDFKEFVSKVIKFNSDLPTGSFLTNLKTHRFSYARYIKIQDNIKELRDEKRITAKQYREAINYIKEVLNFVGKTLKHLQFYHFKYNERNIKQIKDETLQKKLLGFMKRIMGNKYPLRLFDKNINSQGIRSSEFVLKGIKKENVATKTITEELINPLIDDNKIKLKDDESIMKILQEISKRAIEEHTKEFTTTVGHDPIQIKSMMEMMEIIAMEVPIWHEGIKGENITGHIDLLGVKDDTVIVIEYKPDIIQVYKGITQVCIYAYLISEILEINVDKFKCIIYSPALALSLTPKVINDVIEFVHALNLKRESKITLKYKPNDFETELTRISKFR